MRLLCARDEEVARLLCRRVVEFTAELPLTNRAVEFVAWREHGCRWTESLTAGADPGDLKWQFAAVRAALSRGPAKAKLFVENMVPIGENLYARKNHRLIQIMQLPMQDRRRAVYTFLRGGTPLCIGREDPTAPAVEPVRRPPQRPAGDLSEGTAARTVGAQVVNCARAGHGLVPLLDGGGGAGLQPVDRLLGCWGLPGIQVVVPRGIGAVVGHGAWYHGEGP